jgi:hypothetical protein
MLQDGEIRQLAEGSGGTFIFDVSTINARFYEPLLRSLQRFAPAKIEQIAFTRDRLAQERVGAEAGTPMSTTVLESIARNRANYVRNIVELLAHVIPKSVILWSVSLSNIELTQEQLLKLCQAFAKSRVLKKVSFHRVPIGDSGLNILLSHLNDVRSISLTLCALTRESTHAILAFVDNKRETIATFQVSPAEFPPGDITRINDALSGSGQGRGQKRSLTMLRRENEELKAELARLRQSVNAVLLRDNVFVVGKGAEEFVRFLREIGGRLQDMENRRAQMEHL